MNDQAGSIGVEQVSFRYGPDGHRLRSVSMRVTTGEVCALLGPNGAGKTTLLRCLLGLLTPHSGTITIGGVDVSQLSVRQRARMVAYVPQNSTPAFPFSTAEVVLMGRSPHLRLTGSPSAADRASAEASLAQLGLAHLANRAFTRLSGGERQLALIARALTQRAPVLVLDEPTAALDYGNEVRLLALLRELAADGRTILMTTHQPDHALRHANRAVLLRDGAVTASGPPEQVLTSERLTELYQVPIHVCPVELPRSRLNVCVPLPHREWAGPESGRTGGE